MKNIQRISFVHYQPIEFFPPALNFIQTLKGKLNKLTVHTCWNLRNSFRFQTEDISLKRYAIPESADNLIKRIGSYFEFIFLVAFRLVNEKPDCLIYYETNSALPVFLYYFFSFKKPKLVIHYHEYNSVEQYKGGMKLVYLSYLIEKHYLWKKANWISQTNQFRKDLFHKDHPHITAEKLKILPNYPPKEWCRTPDIKEKQLPLKVIYIGSLGMDNFYLKEFCDWVIKQKGDVQFDIYSQNYTKDAFEYLNSIDKPFIHLNFEGIWYYDLPKVIMQYDVGLILYQAFNQNFIFNETNKLFEYHACGLDVWFSEETIGIHRYITQQTFPKIVPLNFKKLEEFNWREALNKNNCIFNLHDVSCERVFTKFYNELKAL